MFCSIDGGDVVDRKDLLLFINSTLQLNLHRIEDTASGCVACQLLDIMYPNVVPMNKISWTAHKNFECVANYQILQYCFKKLQIDRHIAVDRLISGKRLDNLEFMQWFKRHYESIGATKGDYDCFAERRKGKGGARMDGGSGHCSISSPPALSPMKSNFSRVSSDTSPLQTSLIQSDTAESPVGRTSISIVKDVAAILPLSLNEENFNSARSVKTNLTSIDTLSRSDTASGPDHASAYTYSKMKMIMKENVQLRKFKNDALKVISEHVVELTNLEMERDFYFDKLRDIEIIIQHVEDRKEGTPLSTSVLHIIYSTPDGI